VFRATSKMTATSTPNGNTTNTVESAMASTNNPPAERTMAASVRPKIPTGV